MRKTLLSLLLFSIVHFTKAQHKLPSLDYKPQSPVTAAFTRYGDIPVDLSTGVPGISVPIYTLSSHGINVPISISYHASGVKVRDIASAVGLGWVLNEGGVITRSVFGQPDEYLEMYSFGQPQTLRPPWKNKAELYQSYLDAEATSQQAIEQWNLNLFDHYLNKTHLDYYSDRYNYSLGNGESGVFRRDFGNNNIRLIPYKPIKPRFYWTGSQVEDLKIDMTTAEGTLYTFKRNKYDVWHPEKIINSSKTDSVVFYSHYEEINSYSYNETQDFGVYKNSQLNRTIPYIITHPLGACAYTLALMVDNVISPIVRPVSSSLDEIVLIDSIVSADASIRFTYAQDRQDYQVHPSGLRNPHSRLTKVQVFSKLTGLVIKEVIFLHSYKDNVLDHLTKRLMLDGVQIGANGEEKYAFKYNAENMPPYTIPDGNMPSFQEDLWGYKNREGSNTLLCAEFAPFGAGNLFPDEEMAKACILEEVKYPTGGKTIFEYESNRVPNVYGYGFSSPKVPADGKVGGLRIKKISNYAYDGATPEIKNYQYVFNRDTDYGVMWLNQFAYTQQVFNLYTAPYCNGGVLNNYYINYSSSNISVSKPFSRYIGGAQAPVIYDQVTEYYGNDVTNMGKTIYHYEIPSKHGGYYDGEPRFAGPWPNDIGNYTPQLTLREDYKNDNGQYKLVRKIETFYTTLHDSTFVTGLNLASDLQFNDLNGGTEVGPFNIYTFEYHNSYFNTLHYSDNLGYTGLDLPWKTSVYDYVDDNNYVKTIASYEYNQYGQQTAEIITTSKGDLIKTKSSYPVDYPTQAPYNTMIERNIISPVIEQFVYKNSANIFLQSTKTNYNYWDFANQTWSNSASNQILPQAVETIKGSNAAETRLQYFSYDDKGNPVYVAKENDVRQLYIWAHNKTYPVAHIVNVPESQRTYIAYTSFEEDGNGGFVVSGNWIISGGYNTVINQTAPTGSKCLVLGTNALSKSIPATSTYILSYWYSVGSTVNVSGNATILTTSAPKNGWIYVKRRITGTSSITITGSGYIDEVRLYPESAQMTTYSYDPLVGMTAQCDVSDNIIHYTYDASGRLTLVRDDNGNILKKICYNYQGQAEACGTNATPLWQNTGVTRCKPCPANSNYITNIQQREERDNNANSDTYGNTRWIDVGFEGACVIQPDWQFTGTPRCIMINNQNTGEQERQQIDVNPCSGSNGQTRWQSIGTNTTACPLPPAFRSLDVSGNYYNQNCGAQQIPLPYYVSMPEGSYISETNVTAATNLAREEAQRRANESGGCITVYVKLVAESLPDQTEGTLTFGYTNYHFRFYSNAAGTVALTLPGDLQINIQRHGYYTDDGGAPYDHGYSDVYINGFNGNNEAVLNEFQSLYCDGTHCFHEEVILQPGRYVIIP